MKTSFLMQTSFAALSFLSFLSCGVDQSIMMPVDQTEMGLLINQESPDETTLTTDSVFAVILLRKESKVNVRMNTKLAYDDLKAAFFTINEGWAFSVVNSNGKRINIFSEKAEIGGDKPHYLKLKFKVNDTTYVSNIGYVIDSFFEKDLQKPIDSLEFEITGPVKS